MQLYVIRNEQKKSSMSFMLVKQECLSSWKHSKFSISLKHLIKKIVRENILKRIHGKDRACPMRGISATQKLLNFKTIL